MISCITRECGVKGISSLPETKLFCDDENLEGVTDATVLYFPALL